MAISLRIAGAVRNVSAIKLLAGGSLRPAKSLKMMRGDVLVTVATFGPQAGSLTASASPEAVFGSAYSRKPTVVTSTPATVTPSNGVSPYRYAWAQIDGQTMTALSPAQATTQFRATLYNEAISGTFVCTVTDAVGNSMTCTVTVQLSHEGYGDGPIP